MRWWLADTSSETRFLNMQLVIELLYSSSYAKDRDKLHKNWPCLYGFHTRAAYLFLFVQEHTMRQTSVKQLDKTLRLTTLI